MCRLSWNLGASTSWYPQGLSRPVMGLLYLHLLLLKQTVVPTGRQFRRKKPNFFIWFYRFSWRGWKPWQPKVCVVCCIMTDKLTPLTMSLQAQALRQNYNTLIKVEWVCKKTKVHEIISRPSHNSFGVQIRVATHRLVTLLRSDHAVPDSHYRQH
jgi:hypothetical protein